MTTPPFDLKKGNLLILEKQKFSECFYRIELGFDDLPDHSSIK